MRSSRRTHTHTHTHTHTYRRSRLGATCYRRAGCERYRCSQYHLSVPSDVPTRCQHPNPRLTFSHRRSATQSRRLPTSRGELSLSASMPASLPLIEGRPTCVSDVNAVQAGSEAAAVAARLLSSAFAPHSAGPVSPTQAWWASPLPSPLFRISTWGGSGIANLMIMWVSPLLLI